MKILLHICCAPCAIYPLERLRDAGAEVMGFFYRRNIHPYTECLRREEALEAYSKSIGFDVIYQKGYDIEDFIRNIAFREKDRCRFCYYDRLRSTALIAKRGKFDAFSTTLLYSKFQKHGEIQSIGESIGKSMGVKFHYEDFRKGWKKGIDASKSLGMYRQSYCGCIYSEKERYYKSDEKRNESV
jgi:predicted adenine nucleotide alpha hydrolase (AANH) superfamily ATPase